MEEGVLWEEEEEEEEEEEGIPLVVINTSRIHPSPNPPFATPPSNGDCQNGFDSPVILLSNTASLVLARCSNGLKTRSVPTIQACNKSDNASANSAILMDDNRLSEDTW